MADSSQTMSRLQRMVTCALLLAVVGCGLEQTYRADPSRPQASLAAEATPEPVVAKLQQQVRGDLDQRVPTQQASVLKALSEGTTFPARFKRPLVVQGLTEPWKGLMALEQQGSRLAEVARSGPQNLPTLIERLEAGMDRVAGGPTPVPPPTGRNEGGPTAIFTAGPSKTHHLRVGALPTPPPAARGGPLPPSAQTRPD